MTPFKNKTIIIAPLNWGLGHATRCMPLIHQLQEHNRVILASDGEALVLLRKEYPALEWVELPAYNVDYKYNSVFINMVYQFPKIYRAIFLEQKAADRLVKRMGANVIISDNRMGFWSKNVEKNIYMTHQLNIHTGTRLFSMLANMGHYFFYRRFDECWVPDYAEGGLSGKLSKNVFSFPTKFIDPLSRMHKPSEEVPKTIDVLIVLSGPEPQRTKLEVELIAYFKSDTRKIVLVRGTERKRNQAYHSLEVYDLLDSVALNKLINTSKHIICRSGYSSIMDLVKLGRSATVIPTPGQTEQEYLAKYLKGKYGFDSLSQSNIKEHLKI